MGLLPMISATTELLPPSKSLELCGSTLWVRVLLVAPTAEIRIRLTTFGFSEKGRFLDSAPLYVLANSALNNRPKKEQRRVRQRKPVVVDGSIFGGVQREVSKFGEIAFSLRRLVESRATRFLSTLPFAHNP